MPLDFVDTSSEYVLVPDNSILDVGSADFCCMYWFRATTNGDSIFTKGRNTGGNPGWQIRMNGSGVLLATFSDGSGGFDITLSTVTTNDGVWRHVAIVRDNGAGLYRLYVNGVQDDTTAINNASGSLNNSDDMLIGATHNSGGSPTEFITGAVEDARQYSRALSADEILNIYTMKGRDGIVDSLVVRYLMNEFPVGALASGAGSVKDSGPNGLNGNPTNTPTYAAGELNGFKRRFLQQ